MSTALNMCERYDVWWWRYFTGNFLRNQLTWQHSLQLSPPISDWRWSHRIGIQKLSITINLILVRMRLQYDIWGSDRGLAPCEFCTKYSYVYCDLGVSREMGDIMKLMGILYSTRNLLLIWGHSVVFPQDTVARAWHWPFTTVWWRHSECV